MISTYFNCLRGIADMLMKKTNVVHVSKCNPHNNVAMSMLKATSHTRLWARDQYISSTLIGGNRGPVRVRFTLHLRDQRHIWMQEGCKVYEDSYMTSNESCFMVTWIIFKNRLLEVGLTQNRETMALQTLTTVDLFYCIICEDPHESKFSERGPGHIWLPRGVH